MQQMKFDDLKLLKIPLSIHHGASPAPVITIGILRGILLGHILIAFSITAAISSNLAKTISLTVCILYA